MAPEDMKKTTLITKTGLYDWIVKPSSQGHVWV
jgi:hypothetical protein